MNPASDIFAPLERQVDDLLTHLHEVRQQNRTLRTQVQQLQLEKQELTQRIATAADRLQTLHNQLPDDSA